ncbi:MAG: tRNA isopentenyl-2-thiomethyl-A-37 hydroxylase MiaE [Pseudomonadota bacterium]
MNVSIAIGDKQTAAGFAADVPPQIAAFLQVPSSTLWAQQLAADLPTLLIDHANCELKAASTALALLHRYARNDALAWRLSRLAREELRHYEQVREWLRHYEIDYSPLSAAAYARGLRDEVALQEPERLVDTLIVGALIEARSCERFALIAPLLDAPLARFYRGLLASESRHFEHYLELADAHFEGEIDARVDALRIVEQQLIVAPTEALRFHSGPLADE